MKLLIGLIALAVMALAAPVRAQDSPEALYKTKCQACHGQDGKGETAAGKKLGAKDFQSPEVTKMSDAALFDITKKGKDKMPAYDKKLRDDQIKGLIKYIRTLK
ncbi:MAG TPA: cytochrome c [Terriglobales bacterium]|nr:cytochrome c [Terriglobales bacterium]